MNHPDVPRISLPPLSLARAFQHLSSHCLVQQATSYCFRLFFTVAIATEQLEDTGNSLELLYTRYIWSEAGRDREKSSVWTPTNSWAKNGDVKVLLWCWILQQSLDYISSFFFFRGQRFRWERKKDKDKGEEKRSIFNVPNKWGKRGERKKERFHFPFYLFI